MRPRGLLAGVWNSELLTVRFAARRGPLPGPLRACDGWRAKEGRVPAGCTLTDVMRTIAHWFSRGRSPHSVCVRADRRPQSSKDHRSPGGPPALLRLGPHRRDRQPIPPPAPAADLVATLAQPSVRSVNPANGSTGVLRDAFISVEVNLPNGGIDPASLTDQTVYLYRRGTGERIRAVLNTSGARGRDRPPPRRPARPEHALRLRRHRRRARRRRRGFRSVHHLLHDRRELQQHRSERPLRQGQPPHHRRAAVPWAGDRPGRQALRRHDHRRDPPLPDQCRRHARRGRGAGVARHVRRRCGPASSPGSRSTRPRPPTTSCFGSRVPRRPGRMRRTGPGR